MATEHPEQTGGIDPLCQPMEGGTHQVYRCTVCGSMVVEPGEHSDWHDRIEKHLGSRGNWRHPGAPVPERRP